jgi:hypothetical protein
MYVEVSGRQTGKSTRMVEDIVLFLEENGGKTALVVSPTGTSRKLLKEKIFQKCGYCINRVITSHKMLPPMNTMKQYVDEFFYVKEIIMVHFPVCGVFHVGEWRKVKNLWNPQRGSFLKQLGGAQS